MTVARAISEQEIPKPKSVKPVVLYKGSLTLGNSEKFPEESMRIEVEQWPCTMKAVPQTMKTFGVRSDYMGSGSAEGSTQSSATVQHSAPDDTEGNISGLKRTRAYQIDDPDAPGGKRDVDKEELETGYEYGRTAVHISRADMDIVKLETMPGLEVVGFVDQEKV
jgi:ATP-dependent DNA helicase 2 subunit 2